MRWLILGFFVVSIAACSLTKKPLPRSVVPPELESGFLTDYTDLARGKSKKGEPTFLYRAPAVDVKGYGKILLDKVTLWRDTERGFGNIPDEELDRLALRLFTDLWEALDEDYEMVDKPGGGVMRVAVAITDVGRADAPMDVYKADLGAHDRVQQANDALGEPVRGFLANASLELELTDSESGRVLAAALDRRLAERIEDGRFDDWAEVEWGFDAWARLLATRLREARQSTASGS